MPPRARPVTFLPMNEQTSRPGLASTALLALAFTVVFFFGLRTMSAPESWFHFAAGKHLAENGVAYEDPFSFSLPEATTWRQTSWLYDWLISLIWRAGGAPLVTLAHALMVTGAFMLISASVKNGASAGQRAGAVLLGAWILAPVYSIGPRLLSLVLIALYLNRLQAGKPGLATFILLTFAQVIWTNAHVSFVLGPFFALLSAVEAWQVHRKSGEARDALGRSLLLFVVLTVATLLNPFGPRAWTESIGLLMNPADAIRMEWISPFVSDFLPMRMEFLIWPALALIAVTFVLRRAKLPFLATCSAILSAFIMVRSTAALDYGAIFCMPFVALGFNTLAAQSRSMSALIDKTALGALTVAVVLSFFAIVTNRYYIYSGSAASFGLKADTSATPAALLDAAAEHGIDLPSMMNVAQDGGYLLWARPNQKVYVDPRVRLYGGAFLAELYRPLTGQAAPGEDAPPEPAYDAILLNATWSGARATLLNFITNKDWGIAYFDGSSILLLRKTEANMPALENSAFSRAGLTLIQQDYNRFRKALENSVMRPSNPIRLIGASSIYQVLGRYEESLAILNLLTEGAPRNVSALINRGIAELSQGQSESARASLMAATRLVPENALAWLWLERACLATGNEQEAMEAEARGRSINPELADRFADEVKK